MIFNHSHCSKFAEIHDAVEWNARNFFSKVILVHASSDLYLSASMKKDLPNIST